MNADVLTTKVTDGIALITLGSPKRIYFDAEMGDALTEALEGFAGDASVRVVVVTGGAPGLDLAIYGLLLIAFVGLAPRGIAGLLSALVLRRFRFPSAPEQPHG